MSFAKLFSSITESSLWNEPKEVRILFVSMLARADLAGFIEASVPGLARLANLTLSETESALTRLQAPDQYSKDLVEHPENEGRRIVCVPRGWCIINYEEYRERRGEDERREYLRCYMRKYRLARKHKRKQRKQNVNTVNPGKPRLTQADADTDTEYRVPVSTVVETGVPFGDPICTSGGGGGGDTPARGLASLPTTVSAGGTGSGQQPDLKLNCENPRQTATPLETARAIYDCYPKKVARKVALRSILRALKTADPEALLRKTKLFASFWTEGDLTYCPHPSTWFNQERFNDDPATWRPADPSKNPHQMTSGQIRDRFVCK